MLWLICLKPFLKMCFRFIAKAPLTHTKGENKKSGHAFYYMKHFPRCPVTYKQCKKKTNPAKAGADEAPAVKGDLQGG